MVNSKETAAPSTTYHLPPTQLPRVAIVHDWLVGGGAEKVVLELHRMFPDAPIYTSYCTDEWRKKLDGKVVTGYLQYWPFSRLRKFLPVLRIWWFTHLDLKDYDLVISSSGNGEAKFILSNEKWQMKNGKYMKRPLHICYCNTPTHFYWRHYEAYLKNPGFGFFDPLARIGLKILIGPLRKWDLKASRRPDVFLANSTHIQSDIKKYYNRDSTVVFPPVDTERFDKWQMVNNLANGKLVNGKSSRKGYVTVGRLVPNKRVDIIVQACSELSLHLTVVGRGPELNRLQNMAGPTVKFITDADDEAVAKYMAGAAAFLFASFEDFGIAPVEAMAVGTPVIAYKAGGALDYVIEDKTGIFFVEQTSAALSKALRSFDSKSFNSEEISKNVQRFSVKAFQDSVWSIIKNLS